MKLLQHIKSYSIAKRKFVYGIMEGKMRKRFKILAVNISRKKGEQKVTIDTGLLIENHGLDGDAHAGKWHRQVSLLANEDIDTMRNRGVSLDYGDFAENITTEGIDLAALPLSSRIYMGDAILEVTQIGKECHHGCRIYQIVGDCVMPRKGIFAKVIRGGRVNRESSCYFEDNL